MFSDDGAGEAAISYTDQFLEAGVARHVNRGLPQLHAAVAVGVRAGLLEVGRRGQDHVCHLGRLRQEDVLHAEEVEVAERIAGAADVGVR